MWDNWATRYLVYSHSRTLLRTLMAYLLIGFIGWLGTINQQQPKYITNPQTAQEFTQRCQAHIQDRAWQQALKDCNKAITLNDTPPEAYFGLVLFVGSILKTSMVQRLQIAS